MFSKDKSWLVNFCQIVKDWWWKWHRHNTTTIYPHLFPSTFQSPNKNTLLSPTPHSLLLAVISGMIIGIIKDPPNLLSSTTSLHTLLSGTFTENCLAKTKYRIPFYAIKQLLQIRRTKFPAQLLVHSHELSMAFIIFNMNDVSCYFLLTLNLNCKTSCLSF